MGDMKRGGGVVVGGGGGAGGTGIAVKQVELFEVNLGLRHIYHVAFTGKRHKSTKAKAQI